MSHLSLAFGFSPTFFPFTFLVVSSPSPDVLSCIRNPLRSPTFPGFSSPPQSSAFADIRIRVCFNNTCIMLYYSFMQPLPAFRLVRRVRRRCCCVVVVALLSTFQCGVRRLRSAFGVWCSVFGVWCLVFGVWCLVFGVRRCLVSVVVVSVVAAAAAVVVVPPFGRRRCVGWSLLSSVVFCFLSSLFTLHSSPSLFWLLSSLAFGFINLVFSSWLAGHDDE